MFLLEVLLSVVVLAAVLFAGIYYGVVHIYPAGIVKRAEEKLTAHEREQLAALFKKLEVP